MKALGFILAFQALPSIIFFAALLKFLYYIGIMEKIISVFARVFVKVIGERIIETEVKSYQDLALC
jgi:CNT family concentrative nucleoside transporter